MKLSMIIAFLAFAGTSHSQDNVILECGQDAIVAKILKELVVSAGYGIEDVHLHDDTCVFNEEDENFFIRVINPLDSCGSTAHINKTHVEFANTISTAETGGTFPYGIVFGSDRTKEKQIVSALISCTYRIDLRVSTMFLPNITITRVLIPDTFGKGYFDVAMMLYTDGSYRNPYTAPPIIQSTQTLYVGVNIVDDVADGVYLTLETCWGTVEEDHQALPSYPLIQNKCPVPSAAKGRVEVTQNGIGIQALWNAPVFQFLNPGDEEEFETVWLHCNVKIYFEEQRHDCDSGSRRRRRSLETVDSRYTTPNVITVGPLRRFLSRTNKTDQTVLMIEQPSPQVIVYPEHLLSGATSSESNPMTLVLVIGILGSLALVSIILALFVIMMKMRRGSAGGLSDSGKVNGSFAT